MGGQDPAVSSDAMRAQADQINAAAREATRTAREQARLAAQLAWQADLNDAADAAKAAHDAAAALLPALEVKVTEALAAEREAEDLLNSDRRRLTRRTAGLEKARADRAAAPVREDLAVRIRELALIVSEDTEGRDMARDERVQAEGVLAAAETQVSGLYAAWADAARKAENPGPAPHQPGIAELDDETRRLVSVAAMLMLGGSDTAPAKPDRAALMRDQTRMRALNSRVIVPPRMPT